LALKSSAFFLSKIHAVEMLVVTPTAPLIVPFCLAYRLDKDINVCYHQTHKKFTTVIYNFAHKTGLFYTNEHLYNLR
jgi:hypothetical protein